MALCESLGRPLPQEVVEVEKEGAADQDGAAFTRIGIITGTVSFTASCMHVCMFTCRVRTCVREHTRVVIPCVFNAAQFPQLGQHPRDTAHAHCCACNLAAHDCVLPARPVQLLAHRPRPGRLQVIVSTRGRASAIRAQAGRRLCSASEAWLVPSVPRQVAGYCQHQRLGWRHQGPDKPLMALSYS